MQVFNFDELFTGRQWLGNGHIRVVDGLIAEINEGHCDDASARFTDKLVPGFVDVQVNGGGSVLLNNALTVNDIKTMIGAHAQFGTSAMLPTLITDDIDVIERVADLIADAKGLPGLLGVHFEGPHLSVPKKGAHSGEKIRPISAREWAVYERQDLGIKHVTVAPECVTDEDIKRLVNAGVLVSIGHSNATFCRSNEAIKAGVTGFTHLFNAMSPFTSREPGVVGSALLDERTWCGVINDGHHVDFNSLKLALKTKPTGKIMLVTDAMSLIGTEANEFDFFDRKVFRDGDKLTSTTGELAGSHLDMITAVKNAVKHLDVSFEEAVRMASIYPSEFLGVKGSGYLEVGNGANWTLINKDDKVSAVYFAGKEI